MYGPCLLRSPIIEAATFVPICFINLSPNKTDSSLDMDWVWLLNPLGYPICTPSNAFESTIEPDPWFDKVYPVGLFQIYHLRKRVYLA